MVIMSTHQGPQTNDASQILTTHLEGGWCVIQHATLRTHAASLSLPVCFSEAQQVGTLTTRIDAQTVCVCVCICTDLLKAITAAALRKHLKQACWSCDEMDPEGLRPPGDRATCLVMSDLSVCSCLTAHSRQRSQSPKPGHEYEV